MRHPDDRKKETQIVEDCREEGLEKQFYAYFY